MSEAVVREFGQPIMPTSTSSSVSLEVLGDRPMPPENLRWHVEGRGGHSYDVRPIRPEDAVELKEFHRCLSERSTYLRFFSSHPELSDKEVEHFTHVDYEARLALVAEEEGRMIAVGRFDRLPGTHSAEVAFVVGDSHQRRGVGSLLLDALAAAARDRGVTTFVAETLSENRAMLEVVHHSGFAISSRRDRETVTLVFPIAPTEAYRASLALRTNAPFLRDVDARERSGPASLPAHPRITVNSSRVPEVRLRGRRAIGG